MKSLDTALQSFNVHRQAYYGGTFVGNHVHRALKVKQFRYNNYVTAKKVTPSGQMQNTDTLCSAPLKLAEQSYPDMEFGLLTMSVDDVATMDMV